MKKKIEIKLGQSFEYRGEIYKVFVLLIFLLLVSRMAYLQIIKQEKYQFLSQKNRVRLRQIVPERGKIYDANGDLIVTNISGYRLMYLKERKYDEKILKEMAQLTGYTEDYLEKRIKYGEILPYTRENVLIEDLNLELAHKMMEKISNYPYLEVQNYSKRKYVSDSLASHTIGYIKKINAKEYENLKEKGYSPRDFIGKEGIEKTYDYEMKGKPGYEYVEVNALNKAQKIEKSQDEEDGFDVHLTIDMKLQKDMEKVFEEENLTGSLVAMEAKTGKVIAMVSYPTFSLTTFSSRISQKEWDQIITDPRKPLVNKSIAGEYPPGSTYKLFSGMAFFEDGVKPKDSVDDLNGTYKIGEQIWRSWKKGGHGKNINFEKSIIESVNPYYYSFADKYGHKTMAEVAESFGYGKKTEIDVAGERKGVSPSEKWKRERYNQKWYKGDTINMSIGQGYVLATPLQVAVSYMAVANKGLAYKPRTVDYLERDGERVDIKPEVLFDIKDKYPKWYYDTINKAMIKTVDQNNGTAKTLRTPGLKIAAKSGSAQNHSHDETHAWVAGYFPADKEPEVVFTVLLEGAGSGGSIAGGVAKKFVDKYLEYQTKEMK